MDIQIGERFSRLVVKEQLGSQNNHRVVKCDCDCGREVIARQDKLLSGRTKSCGCLGAENNVSANETSEEEKRNRDEIRNTLLELRKSLILANRLKSAVLTRRMIDIGIPASENGFDYTSFDRIDSPRQAAKLLLEWANLVHEILSCGPEGDAIRLRVSIEKIGGNPD